MEKLPQDIILDTFLRLPHQSIINCKLVCKSWRVLLRNTKLDLLFLIGTERPMQKDRLLYYGGQRFDDIDMHGHYSYGTLAKFDSHTSLPGLYKMIGSCNGLVCFSVGFPTYDPIYICNPNTGEYVNIPEYILIEEDYVIYKQCRLKGSLISGYGYSYSMDEYKVVRMYARAGYPSSEEHSLKVQVYTLGNSLGWRDKGRHNFSVPIIKGTSVCANGALHWIEIKKHKILAFDLADEKFMLIPLPSVYSCKHNRYFTLKLLRGYLSVFRVDTDTEQERTFVNIWSLKKKKMCNSYDMGEYEFGNYWYWNKEFSISTFDGPKDIIRPIMWDDPNDYHPFAVTKSNQVLLWLNSVLCCYDSKTRTFTKLWDDPLRLPVEAYAHFNSLVSLEALGEKSKKRV